MKEKDLFAPLKKFFNEKGYKVYAEVPSFYRGVDFVAVKGDEQIAVEMKTSFNKKVIWQAYQNTIAFHKSYVAFPSKDASKPIIHSEIKNEKLLEKYCRCSNDGIGILQVFPSGLTFEALEPKINKPNRVRDFSVYKESDDDEAGLPCQKGVSEGYMELKAIKEYVKNNPNSNWKEIFNNVSNHYSSPASLSGSMRNWRGFDLKMFKKSLNKEEQTK
jgi:hypothetical protein